MAIAFDAASGTTFAVAASSVTLAHTCSGSDRILFVSGWVNTTAGNLTATYNGVSMTPIATVSSIIKITLFYLLAPDTGANNIVVSWDGTPTVLKCAGSSYTGVHQSGQPDSSNTGTDSSSPFDISTTTIADNCWTIAEFGDNGGSAMTVGSGTTNRAGSGTDNLVLADSNSAKTPAGSVTLQCTGVSGGLQIMASFKPKTSTITNLNLSDTPTIIERFLRVWTTPRSFSDSPILTERLTRSWSLTRGFSERITITESSTASRFITAILSEFLNISDSISRFVGWNRSPKDTISITERFSRTITSMRSFSESLGITDLLTRMLNTSRMLLESVSIIEYLRTPLNWLKRTKPSTSWTARTKPSPPSSWSARASVISNWIKRIKP